MVFLVLSTSNASFAPLACVLLAWQSLTRLLETPRSTWGAETCRLGMVPGLGHCPAVTDRLQHFLARLGRAPPLPLRPLGFLTCFCHQNSGEPAEETAQNSVRMLAMVRATLSKSWQHTDGATPCGGEAQVLRGLHTPVRARQRAWLGIKERKGKPMAPHSALSVRTVDATAAALGVAPQTVRRWRQEGRLGGQKLGREWVVWWPAAPHERPVMGPEPARASLRALRTALRQVGTRLIVAGNQRAGVQPRRGAVFLTWRRPGGLQLTFAIGRTHPTRGWAPHVLGTELPFWLKERAQWRQVLPLVRRYERLRGWCHPRLLRVAGMGAVVWAELAQLEAALTVGKEHTHTQRPGQQGHEKTP